MGVCVLKAQHQYVDVAKIVAFNFAQQATTNSNTNLVRCKNSGVEMCQRPCVCV